jgi:hypothetical protein
MMGQQVAEVAIDSEQPAMALQRLDTIRSLFGDPPPGWRPHSELARFAAEAGAGKLPPEAIQARANGIAERFGVATPRRAWWVGATHLLAASHLLAQGERRRAEISLDYADRPVHMGTRELESQSGYGLRHLLAWGRQAASPGPGLRREMTAIREGLDEVGAAAAAKRADTWLREGTPEPPPPPVSMAYLSYERDGQTTDWLGDGD